MTDRIRQALAEAYEAGDYAAAKDEGLIWSRPGQPPPEPPESKEQVIDRLIKWLNNEEGGWVHVVCPHCNQEARSEELINHLQPYAKWHPTDEPQ